MSSVALERQELGFLDRVYGLLDSVDFRRADSPADREAIFRLRYDAYLAEGAIPPNPQGTFTDPYDELGNCWIFGVYLDDQLVSSIRLHVATKEFPEAPSVEVFPEFLGPALQAGKIIVDPTRHVVDRDAAARDPHLVYMTMRLGWVAGEYFSANQVLAAVRVEHQAFYRRIFGHKIICGTRPYPLLAKPISLMVLDYIGAKDRVSRRYPFFRSTRFERRMLFERLQMPAALKPQPVTRPNLRVVPSTTQLAG
jgi:hypothetical protein